MRRDGRWFPILAMVLLGMGRPTTLSAAPAATERRLGELVQVEGARPNPLVGFGLVVGLDGTGDRLRRGTMTAQAMRNMLSRMGLNLDERALASGNVAAVMVTAQLPPFARPGQVIECTVAAVGDARSLYGGVLLLTELKGGDGQVYAIAQGSLVGAGYRVRGLRSSTSRNVATTASLPACARVERAGPTVPLVAEDGWIRLQLPRADLQQAARIVTALLAYADKVSARVFDPGTIAVAPPRPLSEPTELWLAELLSTPVPMVRRPVVVVNQRTGTIVVGGEVRLAPAVVVYGDLEVEIQRPLRISQPGPLWSGGRTVVAQDERLYAAEATARTVALPEADNIAELARALREIRATPRQIVGILRQLQRAGSLAAELIVE